MLSLPPHARPAGENTGLSRCARTRGKTRGDKARQAALQQFFEKLALLQLRNAPEQHAIVSHACHLLMAVHQAWDNFFNEPPFAELLAELASQIAIPDTAQAEYVAAVVTCATGNTYGVSNAACPHYFKMIRGFSQREIILMLELPRSNTTLAMRLQSSERCRIRFRTLVNLLDPGSIPASHRPIYDEWASASAA